MARLAGIIFEIEQEWTENNSRAIPFEIFAERLKHRIDEQRKKDIVLDNVVKFHESWAEAYSLTSKTEELINRKPWLPRRYIGIINRQYQREVAGLEDQVLLPHRYRKASKQNKSEFVHENSVYSSGMRWSYASVALEYGVAIGVPALIAYIVYTKLQLLSP
ncbi:MAG: hypothetical protein ABIC04_01925 [Nanoarchaeota archaeon]